LEDIHPYDEEVTTCKHKYHMGCIVTWLDNHKTCPLCRFQIFKPVPLSPDYLNHFKSSLVTLEKLVTRIKTEIELEPYHVEEFYRFRNKIILNMRKGDLDDAIKKIKQIKLYGNYLLKKYKN